MKLAFLIVTLAVLAASSAGALEREAFQLREEFDMAPLSENAVQYYYYIPCPTYSWLWAFTGWEPGDIIGQWFQVGDISTGGWDACDPVNCHTLEQIRVADLAGYGCGRPWYEGYFTVEFDVYCADQYGCPVGPSLWNSGPVETCYGWNLIPIDPPLSICPCAVTPGPPPSGPRILVTATHTGSEGLYPAWVMDNISTALQQGCAMHDYGCLPALYPRPYVSHYASIHTGFYGQDFAYCPPLNFCDGRDTTCAASTCYPDGINGTQYGFVELTWRLYVICSGPTQVLPTTWGSIKSIYR